MMFIRSGLIVALINGFCWMPDCVVVLHVMVDSLFVPLRTVWHAVGFFIVAEGLDLMLCVRVSDESASRCWVVASRSVDLKLWHHGAGLLVVAFVLFWEGARCLTMRWRWVVL